MARGLRIFLRRWSAMTPWACRICSIGTGREGVFFGRGMIPTYIRSCKMQEPCVLGTMMYVRVVAHSGVLRPSQAVLRSSLRPGVGSPPARRHMGRTIQLTNDSKYEKRAVTALAAANPRWYVTERQEWSDRLGKDVMVYGVSCHNCGKKVRIGRGLAGCACIAVLLRSVRL